MLADLDVEAAVVGAHQGELSGPLEVVVKAVEGHEVWVAPGEAARCPPAALCAAHGKSPDLRLLGRRSSGRSGDQDPGCVALERSGRPIVSGAQWTGTEHVLQIQRGRSGTKYGLLQRCRVEQKGLQGLDFGVGLGPQRPGGDAKQVRDHRRQPVASDLGLPGAELLRGDGQSQPIGHKIALDSGVEPGEPLQHGGRLEGVLG